MSTYIGIWIDRRSAHIVSLLKNMPPEYGYKQTIDTIESQVEPRIRVPGGSRSRKTPWGPRDVAVDGKSAARRKKQLKDYFELIIKKISRSDRIIILGPGETKNQLKKVLERLPNLSGRVIMVETVDKMTAKQIAARVRSLYEIRELT